jgi:hypothetical protein
MIKKLAYIIVLSAIVAACESAPPEAYFNRGSPESLLDLSTEVVNVKITSPTAIQQMINTLNKRQPTRADVKCNESDSLCKESMHVLKQFAVPTRYTPSNRGSVALIYERTLVRNCQNRYIDNTTEAGNFQELNYPTLGCSVAINIVQSVSDKKQFTNPSLMGPADAAKPLQAINNYDIVTKPDTTFSAMVGGGSGSGSGGSSGSSR